MELLRETLLALLLQVPHLVTILSNKTKKKLYLNQQLDHIVGIEKIAR